MATLLQEILTNNHEFLANNKCTKEISKYPQKKFALLTCMDTRLVELINKALGIHRGDAKIIQNAGTSLIGEMGDKATQEAYSEVNFLNEYVVTTSPRHSVSYAAAGIVTQEVRQQLRELFPCGCYLFPASIHDIIILDKTEVNEDFAELIHDNITRTTYANDTSNYNPDSEFLSDIVLQYNPGTDTYTIAGSDL